MKKFFSVMNLLHNSFILFILLFTNTLVNCEPLIPCQIQRAKLLKYNQMLDLWMIAYRQLSRKGYK